MGLFGVSLGGKYDFVVCMCYQSGCLGKDFLTIKFTVKRQQVTIYIAYGHKKHAVCTVLPHKNSSHRKGQVKISTFQC